MLLPWRHRLWLSRPLRSLLLLCCLPAPAAVAGGPAPAIADAGGDGDAKFSRYKGVSWIAASAKWQSKLTRTIPAVEPGGKAKT